MYALYVVRQPWENIGGPDRANGPSRISAAKKYPRFFPRNLSQTLLNLGNWEVLGINILSPIGFDALGIFSTLLQHNR